MPVHSSSRLSSSSSSVSFLYLQLNVKVFVLEPRFANPSSQVSKGQRVPLLSPRLKASSFVETIDDLGFLDLIE